MKYENIGKQIIHYRIANFEDKPVITMEKECVRVTIGELLRQYRKLLFCSFWKKMIYTYRRDIAIKEIENLFNNFSIDMTKDKIDMIEMKY